MAKQTGTSPNRQKPAITDPFRNHLGYLLRRMSVTFMADLGGSLDTIGLRPVESTILCIIEANRHCTQAEIGRLLGIQRANMTPLIASLHNRGLITKTPMDGRSHALGLSDEGQRRCDDAKAIVDAVEQRIEARFPTGLREELRDLLRRMLD